MSKKIIIVFILLICMYCVDEASKYLQTFLNGYNINQLQFLYDVDGMLYNKEEADWQFERSRLPWAIKKDEVKTIAHSADWDTIDEKDELLEYSKKVPDYLKIINTVTCYFNKRGQLYSVKESIRSNPNFYRNISDPFVSFLRFSGYFLEDEGYTLVYNNKQIHLILIGLEISWGDEFGKTHIKSLDDPLLKTISKTINHLKKDNFNINDLNYLLLNNNLIIRTLFYCNSTNIELNLKKDEISCVLEFKLTNTMLVDQ